MYIHANTPDTFTDAFMCMINRCTHERSLSLTTHKHTNARTHTHTHRAVYENLTGKKVVFQYLLYQESSELLQQRESCVVRMCVRESVCVCMYNPLCSRVVFPPLVCLDVWVRVRVDWWVGGCMCVCWCVCACLVCACVRACVCLAVRACVRACVVRVCERNTQTHTHSEVE
jgi:hypothetical protein